MRHSSLGRRCDAGGLVLTRDLSNSPLKAGTHSTRPHELAIGASIIAVSVDYERAYIDKVEQDPLVGNIGHDTNTIATSVQKPGRYFANRLVDSWFKAAAASGRLVYGH